MANDRKNIFAALASNDLKYKYFLVETVINEKWRPTIIIVPPMKRGGDGEEENKEEEEEKIRLVSLDSRQCFEISPDALKIMRFLPPSKNETFWKPEYLDLILSEAYFDQENRIETEKLLTAFSKKTISLQLVSRRTFCDFWKKLIIISDFLNDDVDIEFWHSTRKVGLVDAQHKPIGEKDLKLFEYFFVDCVRLAKKNFVDCDQVLSANLLIRRRRMLQHFLDLGFVVPKYIHVNWAIDYKLIEDHRDLYLDEVFFLIENTGIGISDPDDDKKSFVESDFKWRPNLEGTDIIIKAKYEAVQKQRIEIVDYLSSLFPRAVVKTILLPFLCTFASET
jgi:hypothetical protein